MYLNKIIQPGSEIRLDTTSEVVKVKKILSVEFEIEDSNIESVEVKFEDDQNRSRILWTTFMSETQTYMLEVI